MEFDFGGHWDLFTGLPQVWGNRLLGGHKQNLVCTRRQKKGAVSPQETESGACECPGVSSGGVCRQFDRRLNNREGTQSHTSTENLIKDLLSMALPIRTRPSFPHSQSLPSGSFHKPLILIHQKAYRMKTIITEN